MNNMSHSTYESFCSYQCLEKILQICGYQGLTDYTFMISQKDLKNKPELLNDINMVLHTNKLSELSRVDDILPYLRNELEKHCIPYLMIHKTAGNYLKLNEMKYSLSNYLNDKKIYLHNHQQTPDVIYENYQAFTSKYPFYQSINQNDYKQILIDLCTSIAPGIISKYKRVFENYDIVNNSSKYYAKIELPRECDIVQNIKCYLTDKNVILNQLNYLIVSNNHIINQTDVVSSAAICYNRIYVYIELPFKSGHNDKPIIDSSRYICIYDESSECHSSLNSSLIKENSNKQVKQIDISWKTKLPVLLLEYDGIMLNNILRQELMRDCIKSYGSYRTNKGSIISNTDILFIYHKVYLNSMNKWLLDANTQYTIKSTSRTNLELQYYLYDGMIEKYDIMPGTIILNKSLYANAMLSFRDKDDYWYNSVIEYEYKQITDDNKDDNKDDDHICIIHTDGTNLKIYAVRQSKVSESK